MNNFFIQFKHIKGNISTLKRLNKKDVLKLTSDSQLELCTRYVDRLFYSWKKKRVREAIRKTFLAFCHEVKNPFSRDQLLRTYHKTLEHANMAKEVVERHPLYGDIGLEKIIDHYKRLSLMQERILVSIDKAVARVCVQREPFLRDAIAGINAGKSPHIPKHGASGVYMIPGFIRSVAGVFKPFDEEISAPNNPLKRSYRGVFGKRSSHYQMLVGAGIHREVAAYVVDRYLGLKIVPRTCYAEFTHVCFYKSTEGAYLKELKSKKGSFQEFKAGFKHAAEMSQADLENIPFDELHRLVILDMLIGNQDRNMSNLLSNGRLVVAIDHALSFGIKAGTCVMEKLSMLPQMSLPFSESLVEKILRIDAGKLAGKLKRRCFLEGRELQRMRERVELLQKGAREGWPMYRICGQ